MIEEQIIRQLIELNQRVEGMAIPEKSPDPISPFQDLPGLVGFWPMSSVQRSTGDAYDLSGQGRTLSYNGDPEYNIFNTVPYIDLDGTGDYFDRADETDLDILGTETTNASGVRGLTLGGWFYTTVNAGASGAGLISKLVNAGQYSYAIITNALGSDLLAYVSVDGTALTAVVSTADPGLNAWYNVIARFVPSTSLDIWMNGVKTTNTTAIPASIFNGTDPLQIGRYAGVQYHTGRAALCFLCANALPDAIVSSLFEQTKALFGV